MAPQGNDHIIETKGVSTVTEHHDPCPWSAVVNSVPSEAGSVLEVRNFFQHVLQHRGADADRFPREVIMWKGKELHSLPITSLDRFFKRRCAMTHENTVLLADDACRAIDQYRKRQRLPESRREGRIETIWVDVFVIIFIAILVSALVTAICSMLGFFDPRSLFCRH